MILILLFVRL